MMKELKINYIHNDGVFITANIDLYRFDTNIKNILKIIDKSNSNIVKLTRDRDLISPLRHSLIFSVLISEYYQNFEKDDYIYNKYQYMDI